MRRRGFGAGARGRRPAGRGGGHELVVYSTLEEFAGLEASWDALAAPAGSPFVTYEWLRAWWSAFAGNDGMVVGLRNVDGGLCAGACLWRRSNRVLQAAVNEYSEDWDVLAVDDPARQRLWELLPELDFHCMKLSGLPAWGSSAAVGAEALRVSGCRTAVQQHQVSPYLELPNRWDELLGGVSRNLRSKVRRSTKRLHDEGELVFRTVTGPDIQSDLEQFFTLEASGWKGNAGTAIQTDSQALQLFTDFAHAAARRGWLRLHFLELDSVPIGADFSCVIGDGSFLIKTTFDERFARLSPGLVLRAEALQAAIHEGLAFYDFLGKPERYKLQWTGELRERLVIRAYRGLSGRSAFLYKHRLRPLGRRLVEARHRLRAQGGGELGHQDPPARAGGGPE